MIASQFLNEIAEYVDERVAKVVLNGSYEIADFEAKAVTDNTLALRYIIPASEVSLVTKIELKSAEGELVTSNDVHLPITSDTLMLQTIVTKEVTN